MQSKTISTLYEEYREERNVKITEDQFASFVVFFPSLLVIISDGVVDMEEWEYLQQLSHFMAKSFKQDGASTEDVDQLSKCYLLEIAYTIKHLKDYQEVFLTALQAYLAENPQDKVSVLDTIKLFADASEGTSDDEASKIDYLTQLLDL